MRIWLISTTLVLLFLAPASTADPPFNAQVELLGSAVYNAGTVLEPRAWDVQLTGTSSAIVMGPDGVIYTPGTVATGSSRVQHQHKRHVRFETDITGSAFAGFRLVVSDITTIGFCAGFFTTTAFDQEPAFSAYFKKPASGSGSNMVDLVTNNGAGDPTTVQDRFPVANGVPFDVVVQVPGTSPGSVLFWWRQNVGGGWSSLEVSTDVPNSTNELRFSVRVFTDEPGGTAQFLTAQVFEFRSPVPHGPSN